ncbi:MAG: hypothetical protein AAB416_00755 [Patescibacteria group bacterium]
MKNQLRSIVLLCAGGAILAWASFTGSRSLIISEIGIVYLVVCGVLIARHVFALHLSRALLISPLVSGLILMVSGTAVYFISALGNSECAGVLLVPGIIAIASIVTHPHSPIRSEPIQSSENPARFPKVLITLFFLFYAIVTFILFGGRTEKAVLGPWDSVDPVFFVAFFLEMLCFFRLIIRGTKKWVALSLTSMLVLQATTLLALVFPLGFGFDPFIHQAAERQISSDGVISPKTPYYIGHYALVVLLSKILPFSIAVLDRFTLPLIAALAFPVMAFDRLFPVLASSRSAIIATLVLFFGILSSIASPTPWGFSVLLFSFMVITTIGEKGSVRKGGSPLLLAGITLALLALHPLAGIPAAAFFFFVVLLSLRPQRSISRVARYVGLGAVSLLGVTGIPLAFLAYARISEQFAVAIKPFSLEQVSAAILSANLLPPWRFSVSLDPLYFFGEYALVWIMIACAIAGFIVLWKMQAYRLTAITCAWTAIILIGAYGLLSGLLSFPSLPAYEQNEFGNRLLALAHVALLPLIAVALTKVAMSVFRPAIPVIIRSSTLLACGLAATGALYISFPHNDAHVSYHGYNVSRSDIDAVRWIHGLSGREPIVVLSNQVTAAASIREFGFLRYYPVTIEGKIAQLYTYSIPTTSPLAELFREMVRKPSRETMRHAMDLVGVKKAYFVVNRYEPRGPNIIKFAKETTSSWKIFGKNQTGVFEYSY